MHKSLPASTGLQICGDRPGYLGRGLVGPLHVEVIDVRKPGLMIQACGPFVSAFHLRAFGPAGIEKFQLSLRTVAVSTYRAKREYDSMFFFIDLVNSPVVEFENDTWLALFFQHVYVSFAIRHQLNGAVILGFPTKSQCAWRKSQAASR